MSLPGSRDTALPALKQATSTIQIGRTASVDSMASSLAQSLAHPGGNITGLTLHSVGTVGGSCELTLAADGVDANVTSWATVRIHDAGQKRLAAAVCLRVAFH